MNTISNRDRENKSIDELYRCSIECGELQCLLRFGEMTAYELGFREVDLRPFSTDPLLSDHELKEWYTKRGYLPDGERMRKRINSKNFEVIS